MIKKYLLLLPLFILVGCTQTVNTNKEVTENVNTVVANTEDSKTSSLNNSLLVLEPNMNEDKDVGVFVVDPITGSASQISDEKYQFQIYYVDKLLFKKVATNEYYSYNFNQKTYELLNFPPLSKEGSLYQELHISHSPTKDVDHLLLTVVTHDSTDPLNDFGVTRPILNYQNYLYSFHSDTYELALTNEAENIFTDHEDQYSGYSYKGSDETGRYSYYQLGGEGIGCSTISIVDTATNTVQSIEEMEGDSLHDVGCLYINPELNTGFYTTTDKVNGTVANLLTLNGLVEITSQVTLKDNTDINNLFFQITSVEWINNSKIALASDHAISIVDFNSATTEDIYSNTDIGQSYMAWDRNIMKFDGDSTIGLVDYYSANYEECLPGNHKLCPSAKDDDNRYKVVLKNILDGSEKYLLDDEKPKHIIGWIKLPK